MVLFNESVGKTNKIFQEIENMEEIDRKMEKICEKRGKNDSNMIEWERKRRKYKTCYLNMKSINLKIINV